ncbi:ATP-binding protein [Actinoplanes sp. Pm04-4]|uniref:ATP-binding protein n=1 Tax=Paractinoplanes pyxinae TaxID=2997416 RepID=A0ABT4BGW2_9ACTN|nr:ATP-binding protein [Actinoplanes pyxinae]MCY1145712.1 ATP-binding protein [Actinoplanes pyxinae]
MASLRFTPAPVAEAIRHWVVADYTHLGPLRASLCEAIDAQVPMAGPERDDLVERMTIVVTELATNALRHGRSTVPVQLSRSPVALVLDVADDAFAAAPQIHDAGSLEAGGRGLHITHELASDMGWYVEQDQKHVWVQFRLPRLVRRRQTPRIPVFDLKSFLRRVRRLGY